MWVFSVTHWTMFSNSGTASLKFAASLVTQMVKNLPAMQETRIQSLDQKNLLEKGMASVFQNTEVPLQYACQEDPMDRGAWRATVRGVTKSST